MNYDYVNEAITELEKKQAETERKLNERMDQQFDMMEKRIDTTEQLVSNLMLAYAQLTASVETIIHKVLEPESEEDREQFRQELNEHYGRILDVIKRVSDELATGSDDNLGNHMVNMAVNQQTNPSE